MTSTVRRLLTLASITTALVAVAVGLAGPAAADAPDYWPPKESMPALEALLLIVGIPLATMVVIVLLAYGPPLARGESVRPGGSVPESQWLGGPSKSVGELAAPDADDSRAGGSGGSW